MKIYYGRVKAPKPRQVLVYTTNTQARNGKGVAYLARSTGAKPGIVQGWSSVSHYAVCTKDLTKNVHPSISAINIIDQLTKLYIEARKYPNLDFLIPYNGTGPYLSGYTPEQTAEMFIAAGSIPDNLAFENEFANLIILFSGDKTIKKVSIDGSLQQSFIQFIKDFI